MDLALGKRRKKLLAAIFAILIIPALIWIALYAAGAVPPPGQKVAPPFNLSDRLVSLNIEELNGESKVVFQNQDGSETEMDADAFLSEVHFRQLDHEKHGMLFKLFDITSWTGFLWVSIGLLGQILFTGRMVVQWLASEKQKQSVMPVSFWWMSLFGASMLIIYFTWRIELIGVLGQSTGWFIYVRNLWLIYKPREK